jgi:23S rRNA (uracil1939-C5)-methyltransferase
LRNSKKQIECVLEVTAYDNKYCGIAHYEDGQGKLWPVEIPFSSPGDVVEVRLLSRYRGVYRCLVEKFIEKSPDRSSPPCKHFGSCGGCRLQHIPYENQLLLKDLSLAKFFDFIDDLCEVRKPMIPCNDPWRYRNKMEYTFSSTLEGERFLGLVLQIGRGRAFNIEECHISASWCIDVVEAVRTWWMDTELEAYYPPKNRGTLRSLTLREGKHTRDKMMILHISGNPEYPMSQTEIDAFVSAAKGALPAEQADKLSVFIRIQQSVRGQPTQFYEMHLSGPETIREKLYIGSAKEALEFTISPAAFFQPNTIQAEKLYSLAIEMAQLSPESAVYDLYCGTGTLALCAARIAKQVVGIELSPEAILDARANAEANKLSHVNFIQGDVGKELQKLQEQSNYLPPDTVFLDPPRAGLDNRALDCIKQLNPFSIVYVSCNPKTQAENVKVLLEHGYHITAMQAVDQFPHTQHIENIVALSR